MVTNNNLLWGCFKFYCIEKAVCCCFPNSLEVKDENGFLKSLKDLGI
jgi:hypothetical protein